MFEITGDDISLLNDEDLRTLVGQLCEAELRRKGHPVSYVTWGGNQTAKDGGLDVRVSLPPGTATSGFIPAAETGFQVKKPDMPKAAILDEMKPKPEGTLRPVIAELAKASGAYVIVSSTGSTADSALRNRRAAMTNAVKGVADADKLIVDFYDRGRLATWVRDHPGLIPWVRSCIGKSVPGWQSFGSWSRAPDGADDSFLFDEGSRIKTGLADDEDGLSAIAGIERIRAGLNKPRDVVRLVGLSGVGKTRLCEALFDQTIGSGALDPSLVIYTDAGASQTPPPVALVSDLVATDTRAILVIDNCPSDLHRQLAEVVRSKGSRLSLLTVEYDIRDDQPEGTDVFSLDVSSSALIEKLVQRRYPDVSEVDAGTIAEFSGGNARVALALASTVGKKESVSGLSDTALFERLFRQRHEHDAELLAVAQACSLVYSFDGVATEGDEAELPILAALAGKSVDQVHAGVAELKRRDLLQERGDWRAILPHAIANRLAALALENIPASKIDAMLVAGAPPRLRRSFSRRLGYLERSPKARKMVGQWLAPGGMLADATNLDEDARAMLVNVAPVLPNAALEAIERALSGVDDAALGRSTFIVDLLRLLAYEPELFEHCVALMVKFARRDEGKEVTSNGANGSIVSLFYIVLSGTRAPMAKRLKVVANMLKSNDVKEHEIGLEALDAMMTSGNFSSVYAHDFGARSRDYGYHPSTGVEVQEWFDAVMEMATSLALSESPMAEAVTKRIARQWRGLWSNAGQATALESLAGKMAAKGFWRDGWVAVRKTRIYDGKRMKQPILERLKAIEELLRPKDLVSQVRGVVLGSDSEVGLEDIESEDSDDAIDARLARLDKTLENLGRDVARDGEAFRTLLPSLFDGGSHVRRFGEGLGAPSEKPEEIWKALTLELTNAPRRDVRVMCGFLAGLEKWNRPLVEKFLDDALEHPALGVAFPELEASVELNERDIGRLHRALELGLGAIKTFRVLAYGRTTDRLSGPQFRDLVLAIGARQDGVDIAIEIIAMRLFAEAQSRRPPTSEVAEAGRALLARYRFERETLSDHEDGELGRIVAVSLEGEEGVETARQLVRAMVQAVRDHKVPAYQLDDLMKGLLKVHPTIVLDEIFAGDQDAKKKGVRLFADLLRYRKSPLDVVPTDVVLGWCEADPATRYPITAASASLFHRPKEKEPHQWKPLVSELLRRAPDQSRVFAEILYQLRPRSWSGSFASKLESRLALLEQLPLENAPGLAAVFEVAKAEMRAEIDHERKNEAAESRNRGGRFE